MSIDERILDLVLAEIAASGERGTTITQIAVALHEQGVSALVAREACKRLIRSGRAEYAPFGGGVVHVRLASERRRA